jgi:hypothetical protein
MKYLYPYECSTLKLSSPTELQCAIDGNRRDTSRRPSIGHYTSMVEPEVGFYSGSTSPKSNCSSPTLKRPSSPTMTQAAIALRLPGEPEVGKQNLILRHSGPKLYPGTRTLTLVYQTFIIYKLPNLVV